MDWEKVKVRLTRQTKNLGRVRQNFARLNGWVGTHYFSLEVWGCCACSPGRP